MHSRDTLIPILNAFLRPDCRQLYSDSRGVPELCCLFHLCSCAVLCVHWFSVLLSRSSALISLAYIFYLSYTYLCSEVPNHPFSLNRSINDFVLRFLIHTSKVRYHFGLFFKLLAQPKVDAIDDRIQNGLPTLFDRVRSPSHRKVKNLRVFV